jgi:phasin family protein
MLRSGLSSLTFAFFAALQLFPQKLAAASTSTSFDNRVFPGIWLRANASGAARVTCAPLVVSRRNGRLTFTFPALEWVSLHRNNDSCPATFRSSFRSAAFRTFAPHMELVMSSLDLEQTTFVQKASLETLFGILSKEFEGIEKLASLNLQAFKSILAESQEIVAGALSAKDPQELFALHTGQAQPKAEKIQSYCRHVYEILSGTLAEFTTTFEAQAKRYQHDAQAYVDNLGKHAPAGSEAVLTAWKSAMEIASATFETTQKATKQAVETAESNVSTALDTPLRSTRRVVEHAEADETK